MNDTIAAISTGMTTSGIGIVRISGSDAVSVADRIFYAGSRKKLAEQPTHTIHYGFIKDREETIDEVLVMLLRAPRSFTAEDTVEINCHGGQYALKRVLELALRNGARLAEPGEFTKRAFLNGRMDLSQAEAVIDVINAKNEYALKNSISQLRGSLLEKIRGLRSRILYEIAFIESALDDPEHISLEGYPERLMTQVTEIAGELDRLLSSSDQGKRMKEGIRTVIVGKPNAGKSSLLNLLLGEERAIVTDIAGTTRDTLEEQLNLQGISLHIVDTAGIRETEDVVEKIGVDKAESFAKDADLVIYVADSSTELDENDERIMQLLQGKRTIVLLNKTDLEAVTTQKMLQERLPSFPVLQISAREGSGIERFEETLKEMFYQGEISFDEEIYVSNMRQKAALLEARQSIERVRQSIEDDMPEDFFSIDLMSACEELGGITGESASEDLVNEIFSKFCMGK
ncbi:MAG: tRNA uridine-5-carboxymethylaminomethyl(34) synthesis GTPase MnmE [Eubacteriales bacterium]|nr:tRNA uridine-5-carboxymethylaminomethyl(34) synthesis GTPase MnmE [Eubacteriales bacterium]